MRRNRAIKRVIPNDRKYNNVLISKMINKIMLNGEKSIAEKIFYAALEDGAKQSSQEPVVFFEKILENVGPKKIIVLRRFGGSTYSVPKELKAELRPIKAINLIIESFRKLAFSQGKKSSQALLEIFTQSFNNSGAAVSAKDQIHKNAEANAAFAHFQW